MGVAVVSFLLATVNIGYLHEGINEACEGQCAYVDL